MKKQYFLITFFLLSITSNIICQSLGDIAFTAFNADGNKDFAIVVLADIPANSTIYFTDNESNGSSGLTTGEGTLTWSTGVNLIEAGTIVVFTDVDGTLSSFGSSIGTLSESGSFNITASKDGIIAFLGADVNTPTTFIAAIQIGNDPTTLGPFDGDGITLTNTGLVIGTSIIVFDDSASPDGAAYIGARTGQSTFSDYYSLLIDDENNWTNVVNEDGESLLPFSIEAFTIQSVIWSGTTNSNWNTASNWSGGTIPISTDDVLIPNDITNYPTIISPTTVNSVTIESGASLIANASLTGVVTDKRNLPTTNWYLISSPVSGETIEDIITNHTLATGTGSNLGLAPYNNDGVNAWSYQTAASTGAITSGMGTSIKLAAPGNISFTGTVNTTDVIYGITTGDRTNFNLVGNPFTSYINSATFTTENISALTEGTIWLWDGTQYITKNSADTIEIAPTQGFFVEANGNGNISFGIANQSHQGTDTFMRQSPNPIIELFAEIGDTKKSTKLFYLEGKTTDFDNGYDGSLFSGTNYNFALFTELISNNEGKKLAIQTLPNSNFENMIVPIGLIAEADKEITFSVDAMNLPSGIKIYLEDRLNNKFINLLEETYKIVLNEASTGIGQFYLHTTSQKLNVKDIIKNINTVSVYKSKKQEITITGLQAKANVTVYSPLGKKLITTSINSNGISKINLPTLSTGIYIVKVNSDLGEITKKIILE
ncbi:putative secreted protein (Por secretion system target) [Tenacibaculum adriaticum]|uniref:Putative secreted protein (Por secretion system target) n=1 Tax=Tenacibaculum adriaticum TaxID=413713 RepID=A0A5S5DPY9_9FLAO|nr:T9SS type A sorting domain-containing protein [Tenacibaculum adriaticum]TYP98003.1 putative secreted protein (Por secretion system target) [Tenacibaculum adriaticum]